MEFTCCTFRWGVFPVAAPQLAISESHSGRWNGLLIVSRWFILFLDVCRSSAGDPKRGQDHTMAITISFAAVLCMCSTSLIFCFFPVTKRILTAEAAWMHYYSYNLNNKNSQPMWACAKCQVHKIAQTRCSTIQYPDCLRLSLATLNIFFSSLFVFICNILHPDLRYNLLVFACSLSIFLLLCEAHSPKLHWRIWQIHWTHFCSVRLLRDAASRSLRDAVVLSWDDSKGLKSHFGAGQTSLGIMSSPRFRWRSLALAGCRKPFLGPDHLWLESQEAN